MKSLDKVILDITDQSDIALQSDLYRDIAGALTELGLNLAFFTFKTKPHSHAGRAVAGGKTTLCPALTLYLKYDMDFRNTGIDPHAGNWDDQWTRTCEVRDTVNAVLRRHKCSDEYLSAHTFVFVQTLEEIAFRWIGWKCKAAVRDMVCAAASGVMVAQVFWNGTEYTIILRSQDDYKRITRRLKREISESLLQLLAKADKEGHCQTYPASIAFGHSGMNLFHLAREDCDW